MQLSAYSGRGGGGGGAGGCLRDLTRRDEGGFDLGSDMWRLPPFITSTPHPLLLPPPSHSWSTLLYPETNAQHATGALQLEGGHVVSIFEISRMPWPSPLSSSSSSTSAAAAAADSVRWMLDATSELRALAAAAAIPLSARPNAVVTLKKKLGSTICDANTEMGLHPALACAAAASASHASAPPPPLRDAFCRMGRVAGVLLAEEGVDQGQEGGRVGGWLTLALDGCDISIDIGSSSSISDTAAATAATSIDVAAVRARLAKSLSKSQAILSQLQVSHPFNPSLSKCHTQIALQMSHVT